MVSMFRQLFGTYEPIQNLVSGDPLDPTTCVYSYSIDWAYVFNCIVVVVLFYSLCRLIGILLGGGRR